MDLNITRYLIDECRKALKKAEPYSEEELQIYSEDEDDEGARTKATFAKNILEYFGLSLTDENDYGDITE